MEKLNDLSIIELSKLVIDLYDGNGGEIIYGYKEMGISGDRLKKLLIGRINLAYKNKVVLSYEEVLNKIKSDLSKYNHDNQSGEPMTLNEWFMNLPDNFHGWIAEKDSFGEYYLIKIEK